MRLRLLVTLPFLAGVTWLGAEDAPPPPGFPASLAPLTAALSIQDGKLTGPGAEALLATARRAQFTLIGENHGFVEAPEFASALQRSLGAQRYDYHVVEAGHYSVREAERLLRGPKGFEALCGLNRRHPSALAFLAFEEDCRLAAEFVRLGPGPRIWGIDQEMIMAAALNFELLERLAVGRDAATRAKVGAYAARMRARVAEMIATKSAGTMPLRTLQEADFQVLRDLFPKSKHAEAQALVEAMAESAEIYRVQEILGYPSNRARSLLMKRLFMDYYRAAQRATPQPRALFKLGAYHAGRGRSPTNQFDIGNLASELAEMNGRESLHVLVFAAAGEVNRWFPWSPDRADQRKAYHGVEELESLGMKPFFEAAAATGGTDWTVFDVRPLRQRRSARQGASPVTEAVLFQFDFVVVVPQGRAAKYVE